VSRGTDQEKAITGEYEDCYCGGNGSSYGHREGQLASLLEELRKASWKKEMYV
jgi:hypothetical protein